MQSEDVRASLILNQTIVHTSGRYEVGLLWKDDDPRLPNNYQQTLRRFYSLEKRLVGDPQLTERYSAVIKEYFDRGHSKVLNEGEVRELPIGKTWYNPHHPVVNPHKPTKVRVVFDLAASYDGTSLNSKLLKGPDLFADLAGTLLRFRQKRVALDADIERMFHQVLVRPADAPAFCFFVA